MSFDILLYLMSRVEKDFHSDNRRHVYNVNDYLQIDDIKSRLAQCFSHIYRRIIYDFVIINEMISVLENHDFLLDSVLSLSVYKHLNAQTIYELFTVKNVLLYFIFALSKSD